jgi:O-antigen/teichoic acid export membrane protein
MKTQGSIVQNIVALSPHLTMRLSQGVLWNLLGAIFTQGSVFLTNFVLARLLGKEVFGEFGMMQSTLLMLTSIAQVATGLTATKYVAEFRDVDKARAGRVLGLCCVFTFAMGAFATILLLISAPWVASHALKAEHLSFGLSVSSAFVLFSVMHGYQVGALAGLESYRSISLLGVALGCTHIVVCWFSALLYGLEGALGGLAISAIFRWATYSAVLNREITKQGIIVRRKEGIQERGILFKFALPAALSGLTATPAIWLGNAFLVREPGGYAEMGTYTALNNFRMMVLFFPVLLNGVASSILNNQRGQANSEAYGTTYWFNLKATVISATVGAAAMSVLGEWALQAFGRDFVGNNVKPTILLMALSVILETASMALYQLISSQERMWLSLGAIAFPRDALFVGLAYYLTGKYAAVGLAAASVGAHLYTLIMMISINCKVRPYTLVRHKTVQIQS